MIHIKHKERGQSLVLLALVVVGLLAISAVAVDGGSILAERRRAQTAADNAALAAGYAFTGNNDFVAAGKTQARINGFDDNGFDPLVEVLRPPVDGQYAGNNEYIQVRITSSIKPVFSHFIFGGTLRNTVEAVIKVSKGGPISLGSAIFATNPDACNALDLNYSKEVIVTGGGLYSNSSANDPQTNCYSARLWSSSPTLAIVDGGITTVGAWGQSQGATLTMNGTPGQGTYQSVQEPPPPYCDKSVSQTIPSGLDVTIQPGWYPNGIQNLNNKTYLRMSPGIYCIGGSKGFIPSNVENIIGNGVLIYVESGDFILSSNITTVLNAAPTTPSGGWDGIDPVTGYNYKGMLVFMPKTNVDGLVKITGDSDNTLIGTILALAEPKNPPKCTITGSSGTFSLNCQIICDTVTVTGNGNVNISYDPNQNIVLPGLIELMK